MAAWQDLLVDDDERIRALLQSSRRVAVLGIKTDQQRSEPAFYVPDAIAKRGIEIIPVPVYFPDVTEILGRRVYRRVADVPPPLDIVDVFRRSADVPPHVPDLLAAKPRAVWLQTGIRHPGAAETLARAGILVVQDRCLMVEWRRLG